MKRLFSIIVIILFSQLQIFNSIAASDGEVEISSKKTNNGVVKDCFESVNRGIFAFNQGLDKVIFKPLSKGYRQLPQPLRSGTSNVLSNIGNVVTIPNNILQGQIKDAGINSLRLILNTTLGIAGIFDVASYYGLEKRDKEDYGQTLARWRLPAGPYLVLPFLGPTNVRDTVAFVPAFIYADPVSYDASDRKLTLVYALRMFNTRAELLAADHILKLQLDPYLFVRESYWQRRLDAIYDNLSPAERRERGFEPLND